MVRSLWLPGRGPVLMNIAVTGQFAVEPQRCSRSSATLFMHHRCPPASFGPSSKTWPRCEWQRAAHLGADHPVRAVLNELYGLRRDGFSEARPAGARVVLRLAVKERVATSGAVVEAGFVGVHVLARERALGRRLAQDGVLLRREPLPPLLVGEGQLVAVGTHAGSDRAAHAGPTQTAVSIGDLVQVLLVVGLGIVERASGCDLRGDRTVTGTPKRLLVGVAGLLSGPALLVVGVVDRRAVLRAYVVALAHPLRWVVCLPEHCEQVPVGDLLGVEDDEHGLGVSGMTAANLLVGRVWGKASRVADCCRVDAIDLPELALDAPEAAETEDRGAHTLGDRRLKWRAEHGVSLGNGERRLLPPGKRLSGRDHLALVTTKEHPLTSSLVVYVLDPRLAEIRFRSKPIMISPSMTVLGVACEPMRTISCIASRSSRTFFSSNSTPYWARNVVS